MKAPVTILDPGATLSAAPDPGWSPPTAPGTGAPVSPARTGLTIGGRTTWWCGVRGPPGGEGGGSGVGSLTYAALPVSLPGGTCLYLPEERTGRLESPDGPRHRSPVSPARTGLTIGGRTTWWCGVRGPPGGEGGGSGVGSLTYAALPVSLPGGTCLYLPEERTGRGAALARGGRSAAVLGHDAS
ncbi:unnamed protein product [Arctogadus glacialis]